MSDDRLRQDRGAAARSLSCPSGKFSYVNRKAAKDHARKISNRTGKMRPYVCPEVIGWEDGPDGEPVPIPCGGIHLGHLPQAVRNGRVSARDYYRPVPFDTGESSG